MRWADDNFLCAHWVMGGHGWRRMVMRMRTRSRMLMRCRLK